MSEKMIEKRTCQLHENLEILAVDLSQQSNEQDVNKYLCVKCLIEKIGIKEIVLYDKTIDMIKEIKSKQKKQNQDMIQEKVQNIKQLQQSILEFDKIMKGTISKLQNSFDQQIMEGQKEIQQRDSQIDSINLDQGIQILSSIYRENDEYEIPTQKYETENISQFLDSIKQQLLQISTSQQFLQIQQSIKTIEQQFLIKEDPPKIQKNITLSLKQICKIHESDIIMINLNPSESQSQKRFACVECIQECSNNYVSLKEVNKRWIQYTQQQNEIKQNYQIKRQSKFNSATLIIIIKNTLSEIIQSLDTQFKQEDSLFLIKNDYKDFNINQLDEQEIQNVVDILCQKDQHSKLKNKQEDLNQFDSKFYSNLKLNLDNLMQYDILTKHNLIKIIDDNEQDIIKIDDYVQNNNELNNKLDANSFFKKLLISDQYNFILNDVFNFYINLQKELDDLQQQGEVMQLFNQQQQQQSQFFQKQYQLFQSNSNKMKTLIMAEDNLKLLKQLQESNQQQQSKLIEEGKQLEEINLQLTQIKEKEFKLQEKVKQDIELIESLSSKLKDQENINKQLNEKTNEQNQLIQTIQNNLDKTKSELSIKDQELKNNISQNEEKLLELQSVYSFVRTSWTIGKNTILKDDYCIKILKTIEEKTKKKIKNQYLIYCGTKDGLNGQTFWKCVDKLSNLLMIFKSKSGYIFGAFSPCQWQLMSGSYFQDNALSSFLFSQTHDQIYPLKEANKQHSIYCNQSSYGPTFGGGHDLYISADFNGGYSSLGHSYQCNQYQIANTSTHLFGQSTPNIAECEILMLTFG
ncbi:unnamed protein product [Paramecium sonneborni]|uniref:TLDc domain-containing protein n=1 Tax=Paramecium sonneborni TaxID=65129 RepID=A0A8S1PRL4_9CILI|nr:unnamed protein product [Paramecium sonneborni]